MFGLFSSPERKLESRFKEEIASSAVKLLNQNGLQDSPMAGTLLLS